MSVPTAPTRKRSPLLEKLDVAHWANVPREVLLAKINSPKVCFTEKAFYAILLLSWCGPEVSEVCTIRDKDGFMIRDPYDEEQIANQHHLLSVMGLPESRKGQLSRALAELRATGFVANDTPSAEQGSNIETRRSVASIRPLPKPTSSAPLVSEQKFTFAGMSIELPTEETVRNAVLIELGNIKQSYNQRLRELRRTVQELTIPVLTRFGCRATGIRPVANTETEPEVNAKASETFSTGNDSRGSTGNAKLSETQPHPFIEELEEPEEKETPPPQSPFVPGDGKADEEGPPAAFCSAPPTYKDFHDLYPKERLDDAKASERFHTLLPLERERCLKGLLAHLACKRWQRSLADDNGRYIPLASNFIGRKEYATEPPPYIEILTPSEKRAGKRAEEMADTAWELYERNFGDAS
jgi:hypothetical protein